MTKNTNIIIALILFLASCTNQNGNTEIDLNSGSDTLIGKFEYISAHEQFDIYFSNAASKAGFSSAKEKFHSYKFGKIESEGELSYEFQFDKNGNIISQTYHSSGVSKSEYKFNSKNQLIKQMGTATTGEITIYSYDYDNNGNLSEENCFNQNNELQHKWIGEYDQNGQLTKQIKYKGDGTKEGASDSHFYLSKASKYGYFNDEKYMYKLIFDKDNRLIKEVVYDKANYIVYGNYTIQKIVSYEYDPRTGTLTSENHYDKNGDIDHTIIYSYQ